MHEMYVIESSFIWTLSNFSDVPEFQSFFWQSSLRSTESIHATLERATTSTPSPLLRY